MFSADMTFEGVDDLLKLLAVKSHVELESQQCNKEQQHARETWKPERNIATFFVHMENAEGHGVLASSAQHRGAAKLFLLTLGRAVVRRAVCPLLDKLVPSIR